MSYIVTVIFDTDVTNLEEAEKANPDIIGGIVEAAKGRMIGHTRYVRDGFTMDIDEYESEEAYSEFVAAAGDLIQRYGDTGGAAPVDTLWKRHH